MHSVYPLEDSIGRIDYLNHMGEDLSVVNDARVSFDTYHEEFESDKDERLLKYLANHGHWSPFAHSMVKVRIKAPISTERQWFKHTVGVVNNSVSTRYVEVVPQFYAPKKLRKQSKISKQGSSEEEFTSKENTATLDLIETHYDSQYRLYKNLLDQGVAREIARDVLPLATYTTWISTMSLYAAWRIYKQRTGEGAQWEIKQYAIALGGICEGIFPVAWKALKEKGE